MISSKGSRLVLNFDAAASAMTMLGGMAPEDWPEIKKNYRKSKRELRAYIAELEQVRPDYSEI